LDELTLRDAFLYEQVKRLSFMDLKGKLSFFGLFGNQKQAE